MNNGIRVAAGNRSFFFFFFYYITVCSSFAWGGAQPSCTVLICSLQDPTSGLLPLPRVCASVLPAKWPCFTLDVSKTCQSYPYRMSTDSSERDALSPGVNGKRGTRCTCQVLLTTMKVSLKLIAKHIHIVVPLTS